MNCLCAEARAYLKNTEADTSEIIQFVDKYNNALMGYAKNGLSSYVLECIEVSKKLSRRVKYNYGEALATTLRGDILSYGGQYSLALNNYKRAITLLDKENPLYISTCAKINFNYICTGEIKPDSGDIDELLKGNLDRVENYLKLSVLLKDNIDDVELFNKGIEKLKTFNIGCSCTIRAHIDSLNCLAMRVNNIGDKIGSIFNVFDKREYFVLYIDGMLNIAETFIKLNLKDNAQKLVNIILEEKRELKLFDNRIEELLANTEAVGAI